MKWQASAPSNIALIKYMGKKDHSKNIPLNPSLSYTLDHLVSFVEIEINNKPYDCWESLNKKFELGKSAQDRFVNHFKTLKKSFNCNEHFIVRSANNFPANCGLASSASSFAALTKCAVKALTEIKNQSMPSKLELAQLSQRASGSSCRSFFKPWCIWTENTIEQVNLPYNQLIHQVIIISKNAKSISSTQAHQFIETNPDFKNRSTRAEKRFHSLIHALKQEDWQQAFQITWHEFWDMHQLFQTSKPPFNYMSDKTNAVLDQLKSFWNEHQDGPIITMDAGPNIHLLYRSSQTQLAKEIKGQFESEFEVITN